MGGAFSKQAKAKGQNSFEPSRSRGWRRAAQGGRRAPLRGYAGRGAGHTCTAEERKRSRSHPVALNTIQLLTSPPATAQGRRHSDQRPLPPRPCAAARLLAGHARYDGGVAPQTAKPVGYVNANATASMTGARRRHAVRRGAAGGTEGSSPKGAETTERGQHWLKLCQVKGMLENENNTGIGRPGRRGRCRCDACETAANRACAAFRASGANSPAPC